eukprot:TRINITY_DN19678_c0_g1_i4.p1 TRINITY_DN19678_c0_g1~~TRINITY_DN19678_c0_g1_i4.p1  ORF type:complete len:423 (-),score=55.49 TRINITY_DN19678_c0_g1_i4:111-1379(-)
MTWSGPSSSNGLTPPSPSHHRSYSIHSPRFVGAHGAAGHNQTPSNTFDFTALHANFGQSQPGLGPSTPSPMSLQDFFSNTGGDLGVLAMSNTTAQPPTSPGHETRVKPALSRRISRPESSVPKDIPEESKENNTSKVDNAQQEALISEYRQQIEALTNEVNDAKKVIQGRLAEVAALQTQLKREKDTRPLLVQEAMHPLQKEISVLQKTLKSKKEEISLLKEQLGQTNMLQERINQLNKILEQARAEIEGKNRTIDELHKTMKLLESESDEISASANNRIKAVRRRLLIRSVWFRSQLVRLEKLVKACSQIDEFIRPEVTCPACLSMYTKPVLLSTCGHTLCRDCVEESRSRHEGNIYCESCKKLFPESLVQISQNLLVEGICARYDWWRISLQDLRKMAADASIMHFIPDDPNTMGNEFEP